MGNLPESWTENQWKSSISGTGTGAGPGPGPGRGPSPSQTTSERIPLERLIGALNDDASRERALTLLCKIKSNHKDLGLELWRSNGTIFSLLKEIMHVYFLISTPNLTEKISNKVCNVLALFQSVASHPDTRMQFIKANIPEYLYPLISTTNREKPYEFLRVSSLGVIGALLKEENEEALEFLLNGDILPKCLLCLEVGNLLTKIVAAFVLEKLLTIGDTGLMYCCASAERFYSVTKALGERIEQLDVEPCHRLLKHVIRCYVRLSENPRACDSLRWYLPAGLGFTNPVCFRLLHDDPATMKLLQTLIHNVSIGHRSKNFCLVPTSNH